MDYSWMDAYILEKKAAEKDYKEEWGAYRYLLKGKMFGMLGEDKEGRKIITLKLEPSFGESLRDRYEDIRPGYYMNKLHWSSLDLDGDVPEDVLKQMLDMSYDLVFSSLTKKLRKEITEGE